MMLNNLHMDGNMVVIGITGGIGAGKSKVIELLRDRYDFSVYEADKVAADLQQPGQDCYKEMVLEFGERILNEDKTINRDELRKIVMSDSSKLEKLNSIVHPSVKRFFLSVIEENLYPVIFIESAILLQDGYDKICDEIWYVYADRVTRRDRIMQDRGYTCEKANSFMDNQPDESFYREYADRVIDNSEYKDLHHLILSVDEAVKGLREVRPDI